MDNKVTGRIPGVIFAAPKSGSGKTLITCGFLEILKRKGLTPMAFKVGPDYIDPMFHSAVQGIPGRNLDSFFLKEKDLKAYFNKELSHNTPGAVVIEGVMGYYDGIGGYSEIASTYDISRILGIGSVLVIDVHGMAGTIAAVLKGLKEYREDSHITGVILNKCSESLHYILKSKIQEECGLKVYGYLPKNEDFQFSSRYLGLTLPNEIDGIKEKLAKLADCMEKTVKVDEILQDAVSLDIAEPVVQEQAVKTEGRIAVARDEAFCFCYQENLEFLKEAGFELTYFSPLSDEKLPEDICGLIFYGGYPEQYAKELSENTSMLKAVKEADEKNLPIIAECGGFMYLHDAIEGSDGVYYPMAGVIEGRAYKTNRLQNFGYIELFQNVYRLIKGHEFHYYHSTNPGVTFEAIKPAVRDGEVTLGMGWRCMHYGSSFIAGFPHLYYRSGPEFINEWLESCRAYKKN